MTTDRTPLRGLVFIGTSLDGRIARPDGGLDWLTERGSAAGDTGYDAFMARVDTVVMGRNTYETALSFESWPHEGKRVAVLSTGLETDDERITVHRDLDALLAHLRDVGARDVYIDGGRTIRTFLRAGLIDELTITTVPVLLGGGIPLFGDLDHDLDLTLLDTRRLGAGVVQSTYAVVR